MSPPCSCDVSLVELSCSVTCSHEKAEKNQVKDVETPECVTANEQKHRADFPSDTTFCVLKRRRFLMLMFVQSKSRVFVIQSL